MKFNARKEMKRMEQQQAAQEKLNELLQTEKAIDKMISEFVADARERLLDNDEAGFELIANSIFYFQDIKKVVQTIRVQFQTYIKTAQFIDTVDSIRPVLRQAADMMAKMPSMSRNNRDFVKFRKGLLKGQINMKAMASMMTAVNPAGATTRSKDEFDALRERVLIGVPGRQAPQTQTAPQAQAVTASAPSGGANDDFFAAINGD